METEVDLDDNTLLKKDKIYRIRKVCRIYWKKIQWEIDKEQGNELERIPIIIQDGRDWDKYANAVKLIVMNYFQCRHTSKCRGCNQQGRGRHNPNKPRCSDYDRFMKRISIV